ncbi:MAG: hypothetical protein US69_C0014G0013 [candidate division TM6 bacterium GW2011_GWF2_38_10]|nr:MAG: hypothetical protein US69_C0014G0013 [candidate division TM6 bacterium GW2011_GWF2_38_10]
MMYKTRIFFLVMIHSLCVSVYAMSDLLYVQWLCAKNPQHEDPVDFVVYREKLLQLVQDKIEKAREQAVCNDKRVLVDVFGITKYNQKSKRYLCIDKRGTLFYSNGKICQRIDGDLAAIIDRFLVSDEEVQKLINTQTLSFNESDSGDYVPYVFDAETIGASLVTPKGFWGKFFGEVANIVTQHKRLFVGLGTGAILFLIGVYGGDVCACGDF